MDNGWITCKRCLQAQRLFPEVKPLIHKGRKP